MLAYGRDVRAADELRRVYDDYKIYLTEEEKDVVARYEGRNELSGNIKNASGRQETKQVGMEGLEEGFRSTRITMDNITPIGNKGAGWGEGKNRV